MQRLDRLTHRIAEAGWPVGAAALIVLCLMLWLPGFASLPPVDRDEASFAQASRQMWQSGDLVDIRLGEAPRWNKPAGIYWLQATAVALTGGAGEGAIATYRVVSLLGALAAVLLTWHIGVRMLGAGPGFFAAVLLAVAFVMGGEARLAKTDAMLLASIVAAQAVLARAWMGPERPHPIAVALGFWVALAVSVMIKGPIGLMVVGLTVLALIAADRSGRWLAGLRPLPGVLLFLALVVPWYAAITLRSDGGFWAASLGRDLVAKVGGGQEGHGAPPGSYLLAFWLTFWPGAILLALSLPAILAVRRARWAVFLLAWVIPSWIVFELTPTKLVHYVLPTYPALAILTAGGLAATPFRHIRWRIVVAGLLVLVPLIVFGGLAVQARNLSVPLPLAFVLGGATAALAGLMFILALKRGQTGGMIAATVALSLSLQAGLFPGLARIDAIWPVRQMAEYRAMFPGCEAPEIILAGFTEPSALFLLGRDIRRADGAEAGAAYATASCAIAFVSEAELGAFDESASAGGTDGRIEGLSLGSGRKVALSIFSKAD